ncbi:large ribosomal subunit protein uL29m [Hyperolius riggenbachi]|uniref:large ribosomal subunit protein uL29m n=1 Tax=Hyperolius riggenbachi TaxID=752182 RepID=UPI0035A2FF76
MAASAVRGVLSGCGRLCQLSAPFFRRHVGGLPGVIPGVLVKRIPGNTALPQCTAFHLSATKRGLEEFFDDPKNWGEKKIKSGDLWTINQLRCKNSEDLHKLWYVLLKEKNMLLTLEQESKRQRVTMPGSDRLYKVTKSMENLEEVVTERETALRLLQTGQKKARPGEMRKDCFGETNWYKCKEWPIPFYMNPRHMQKKFFTLPYVEHYQRLRLEKQMRDDRRKRNAEHRKRLKLEQRFPHIAKSLTN